MEEKIIEDLYKIHGLLCRDITPVSGGWMNLKWRVLTDYGWLFVKQFSRKRYRPDQLQRIEEALQRQCIIEKYVPCPHIWRFRGRVIRYLDDGTPYMLMDFCPGSSVGPQTITPAQMESLGHSCAAIHTAFAKLPVRGVAGYPIRSARLLDTLRQTFSERMQADVALLPEGYHEALTAFPPILKDLSPAFFSGSPEGIAHEDFTPDNMLFEEQRVSAILDFDRSCYSFLQHDVGRAILSYALWEGKLDKKHILAFCRGYSHFSPLIPPDIVHSLRLTWCIETPWWIQPEFFESCSKKVARFRDEILWLTYNFWKLDALVCS